MTTLLAYARVQDSRCDQSPADPEAEIVDPLSGGAGNTIAQIFSQALCDRNQGIVTAAGIIVSMNGYIPAANGMPAGANGKCT